ncbi:hypothetical protein GQ53DRAFT_784257 [Thozetella sp. PMI_491]|nr:hypothetical protein GQ53DRAFT_784257 [Thozetella sp. PMI_491]
MGCMSHRRSGLEVRHEQKWDYISLNDFKSTSCFAPFAYFFLWFSLFLSVAVYAVDTFTAVNLIAFGVWSSSVQPTVLIDVNITKWIFVGCIILSFINLAFEHIRARKIMNRGSVAECYLDSLAARLECTRFGKGRGWKRFLVFAELTKSKKGAEYIALFTYFSFQSWLRVLVCSGPRQVVNALTIYGVYSSKLQINGANFESSLMSFFQKIRALATDNYQEALVLSGMTFTLVIWVFSFLSLMLAALFFVFFLWHYIPRSDGGLSGYCERKANKRLMKIVSIKINKAMAEEDRKRRKAELKAAKKSGGERPLSMKATLPDVGDDSLPEMPTISRKDTMGTLPTMSGDSRPSTPGSFEMNAMGRLPPTRSTTMNSGVSQFSSHAPLIGGAAEMGRSASPAPSLPPVGMNNYPPMRPGTAASTRSFGGPQLNRMPSNGPATYHSETMPSLPPAIRSPANQGPRGYPGPTPHMNSRSGSNGSGFNDYPTGRSSPAPSMNSYRGAPQSPMGPNGYPQRSATNPMPPRGPQPYPPLRNMTAPMPQHQQNGSIGSLRSMPSQPFAQQPGGDYGYPNPNRPDTANSQRPGPRGGPFHRPLTSCCGGEWMLCNPRFRLLLAHRDLPGGFCLVHTISWQAHGASLHFHLLDPFISFYELNPLETPPAFILSNNMTAIHKHSNGWHPGELAMHKLLRVPTSMRQNPTAVGLPASYAYRVAESSLVGFGALDDEGRPWTTVWGGERGFTRPIAQNILGAQTVVDRKYDPVVQALVGKVPAGDMVKPDEQTGPKLMAGLSIDLETRDRVKLAGRMLVGAVMPRPGANGEDDGTVGEMQVAMVVQEALGNCPKYLNRKDIKPHVPSPKLVSDSLPLPQEALDLIENADLFFLSSTNGETMDTNHRGGPQGFIRVLHNTPEEVTLVYPEYSGNRLYQTLGNLYTNPKIGIAIPDFETSDMLYLTGTTEVLVGAAASAILPHIKVAVKIRVHAASFVKDSLPFRGKRVEQSPYNPPVRRLASESPVGGTKDASSTAIATARLVERQILTPSISRFTFELEPERGAAPLKAWHPGQHVTFDFSEELDHGWSHMRDDDPTSLNDDFIRTFTISNLPPETEAPGQDAVVGKGTKLEITARKNGPATNLLWRHNMRVPLSLPVLGFGGEESFWLPTNEAPRERPVFVAGGVGVTPLLAQASGVLAAESRAGGSQDGLRVVWGLRGDDLALALDTWQKIPGLAERTHLIVTGKMQAPKESVAKARELGAEVTVGRRMVREDLLALAGGGKAPKFYVCAAPEMHKTILPWLEGQEVVSENFNY